MNNNFIHKRIIYFSEIFKREGKIGDNKELEATIRNRKLSMKIVLAMVAQEEQHELESRERSAAEKKTIYKTNTMTMYA